MEVREQAADDAEAVARIDEEIGAAGTGDDPAVGAGNRFERPRRRRADGDDAPAFVAGLVDDRRRPPVDLVVLRLESMIFDAIDADRLKRAVADVQRDLDQLDAARLERHHQCRREVQSGGRRRHRTARAREDGLVAVAVGGAVVPLDVRRQRHVTDRVDRRRDRGAIFGPETHAAPPEELPLEDFAMERRRSFEHHPRSRFQFLPRVHQRLPNVTICLMPDFSLA